jgi:hypothetical protein
VNYEKLRQGTVTRARFRLPPRRKPDLGSSVMLRIVEWYLFTDVSGQSIGPTFKGKSLTLGDGNDRLPRNVGNYQLTLRKIPQKQRSHLTLANLSYKI